MINSETPRTPQQAATESDVPNTPLAPESTEQADDAQEMLAPQAIAGQQVLGGTSVESVISGREDLGPTLAEQRRLDTIEREAARGSERRNPLEAYRSKIIGIFAAAGSNVSSRSSSGRKRVLDTIAAMPSAFKQQIARVRQASSLSQSRFIVALGRIFQR